MDVLGIAVEISITHGQWSKTSMHNVVASVSGYLVVQELEVKNQSSLSRRGGNCLFVQVNCLPCNGISTSSLLIASLKRNISLKFAPSLFLSLDFLTWF